ncbi:MAG: ATP-binding cassette domain-containing protein [Desulfovibrio sp.]|nr:ATP-binding cassette domain-containing protein [Desulfovibrio sp.]
MLYAITHCVKYRPGLHPYTLAIEHLTVNQGDMLAITGESGCGKSTALDLLGLVSAPTSAETFFFCRDGKRASIPDLFAAKDFDGLARLRLGAIGSVLQTGELLPYLSVQDNLLVPALLAGIGKDEALENAHTLAKTLGITHRLRAYPNTLSVGERQRAAIVRALVQKPLVILADEPTAALDPIHANAVMEVFLAEVRERKTTLILVTHQKSLLHPSMRELRIHVRQTDAGIYASVSDTLEAAC